MSDQFVAEIRIFPFNFAPKGWAFCDGQLMPISQNTALFSLLGTFYGGDGKSTFGLPDLQGSAPMQPGQGQGLSERFLGEPGGVESVTLLDSEMPVHPHMVTASGADGVATSPKDQLVAQGVGINMYSTSTSPLTQLNNNAVPPAGGDLPHNNMQPYLTLNFCIALQGIFPQRP
jgi:microcystin-dependent protein